MIRGIERALAKAGQEDQLWLQKIISPNNECFPTLIKLLVEPKYKAFLGLRCVALRAVQLMLRIAAMFLQGADLPVDSVNVGMVCLVDLAGEPLANEVFPEICEMAETGPEPGACVALMVLGELGPEAFELHLVRRLLDLFVALPDRAHDMAEVALRLHAWGGQAREVLLSEVASHNGGKLLCEVLLQLVNRCDDKRRLRSVKLLTGCLTLPSGGSLLYTNDARVLVEILLRELPNYAGNGSAFACLADCFKALALRYEAARTHRQHEVVEVLQELRQDDCNEPLVRSKACEVLTALLGNPPQDA
jgi:hypothetical protein